MSPSLLDFLQHILEECHYVLEVTKGRSKDEILNDKTLSRAIVRSIEIIGEATKKLDDDFKGKYPYIEWKKIAATRDIMIHHYFGIDYEIVWDIIISKIPDLQHFIDEIVKENKGSA